MCLLASEEACVEGYIDIDYKGDMEKKRSMFSFVFMFIHGEVLWQYCLLNYVSMSIIKAHYIAVVEACNKEELWLACLMGDLGVTIEMPMLHWDSQSAIMLAKNPIFHAKTKNIDVKYHFI